MAKTVTFDCPIRTVQWNPIKSSLVAIGSFKGDVFIIDSAANYTIKQTLNAENHDKILQIQWHPFFDYILASASSDMSIRVWDTKNVRTIYLIWIIIEWTQKA